MKKIITKTITKTATKTITITRLPQVSNVDEVCPPWVRKSSRREPLPAA